MPLHMFGLTQELLQRSTRLWDAGQGKSQANLLEMSQYGVCTYNSNRKLLQGNGGLNCTIPISSVMQAVSAVSSVTRSKAVYFPPKK